MTRPPVVSVPSTSSDVDDQARAQKLEKYLYGAMSRTNFYRALFDAEWFAMAFGAGILRVTYDGYAVAEDFPLVVIAPDPRTVYYAQDASRQRLTEVAHMWHRPRCEIEDEWGYEFTRPTFRSLKEEEAWLDAQVKYIEYWRESWVWEEIGATQESISAPEPIETTADRVGASIQVEQFAEAGMDLEELRQEMQPQEDMEEEPKKVRRLKIIHCVVVQDSSAKAGRKKDEPGNAAMVKRPVVMAGYKSIPFYKWSGTATPLQGDDGDLSALFGLTNGNSKNAMGVLAALSMLASIDLESGIKAPNAPVFTDDTEATIDMEQGAINYIKSGSKVFRLQTDVTNPAVARSREILENAVSRITVPEVLSGQVFQLSGQAISGLATAFQMIIGFRQKDRERALEHALESFLALTEEWADEDTGWVAYGQGPYGQYYDVKVKPSDIGGNHRVNVKLSASMPRDTINMASVISMLQAKKQLSLETMLDMLQKLPEFGLASESPMDEITRIYRDNLLNNPEFQKLTAVALGHQVIDLLRAGGLSPEGEMAAEKLIEKLTGVEDSGGPPNPSGMAGGQSGPPGEAPNIAGGGLPSPSNMPFSPPGIGIPPVVNAPGPNTPTPFGTMTAQ